MKALALLMLAACGGSAASAITKEPATTAQIPIGCEVGVLEIEGITFVFDRDKVNIVRGGVTVGRATTPHRESTSARWEAVAAIAAPGGARWAVGLAGGALWRVTVAGEIEAVGERLGVGGARVISLAGSGTTFAIGLAGGVATSRDGLHVRHFAEGAPRAVAAATDKIAVARESSVEIYDLAKGSRFSYAVDEVSSIAFIDGATAQPRLVVRAGDDAYIEDSGALRRVPSPAKLRHLVVSGSRVWMLGRAGLFSLEGASLVRASITVPPESRVFSTRTGDVWLARGGTTPELVRYSLDPGPDPSTWQATVGPVFERTCSSCHLPGGEADLDLSTPASWNAHEDAIRQALHTRTMPPAGTELSDMDRVTLERWLSR